MERERLNDAMNVLIIGNGVIGSVYGAQLALSGHRVFVYAHSNRDKAVVAEGLKIQDVIADKTQCVKVELAINAAECIYDLVLVAVRTEQLDSAFPILTHLQGSPHIIFLGNNPDGYAKIPKNLPGTTELGFPGIGGRFNDNIVQYVRIPQQPTTLEKKSSAVSRKFEWILRRQGFTIYRTDSIDGWLAYHSVFVSCIGAALLHSNSDPIQLGNNRDLLNLMCTSIEQGFRILGAEQGKHGLPRNLAILHKPLLRIFAIRYWARTMLSPMGELFFAAHVRHAPDEMRTLIRWVQHKSSDSRLPHQYLDKLLSI